MTDTAAREAPRKTREEREKHICLLATRPELRFPPDPFPVCPSKSMSKAEIDQVTYRVYNQYRMQQAEALRAAEEREQKELAMAKKVLSEEEMDENTKRLHDECIMARCQLRRELGERYLFKSKKETAPVPLKEFVKHMYDDGIQREKDKEQKLYEKYILPTEIVTARISESEAKQSGERLTSRTGNA